MTTPLFDIAELITPDLEPTATIQEQFEAFDAANPWVYEALVTLTRDWLAAGHSRAGLKAFVEVIRWSYGRQTTDEWSPFRINNNLTSRFVRKLIDEHPEWSDVFATRELRAA